MHHHAQVVGGDVVDALANGGAGEGVELAAHRLAHHQVLGAAVGVDRVDQLIELVEVQGGGAVVDRHLGAWGEALGEAVKAPALVGGGIAIDQGSLQGEAHGADFHLHLGGTGLGALQVDDRAVHIHVATKEVHRF